MNKVPPGRLPYTLPLPLADLCLIAAFRVFTYIPRTPNTAEHVDVGDRRSPQTYVPASDVTVLEMLRLRSSPCQVTVYLERF